jgi:hypothetical protein
MRNLLPASCRQQQASSLRSPDLPATPVVKSLFLAFLVPIFNYLDTFQRYHPAAHHSFQRRQESVDLLFAIDDFNDDRQIHREPQNLCGVHSTRYPETHRAAQNGRAAEMRFARFQYNRFVKRFVIPAIAFADENPQQHRITWNFHSRKMLRLIEEHREMIAEPDGEETKHK